VEANDGALEQAELQDLVGATGESALGGGDHGGVPGLGSPNVDPFLLAGPVPVGCESGTPVQKLTIRVDRMW
jgi:hypothetical protein